MPQLALNCHEFIKKEGVTGFCDCKGFLRLTAQEQAKAEKAIKVTANCAIYAHKTNYTRHATFCKCFFIGFFPPQIAQFFLPRRTRRAQRVFRQDNSSFATKVQMHKEKSDGITR
jgi:hypothetical protein